MSNNDISEIDELILYWKDYGSAIRLTYPGLHEIVVQTIKDLEFLKSLFEFGIINVGETNEQPQNQPSDRITS